MNPRRCYYRKKNKNIIIEGKRKGKTIYLWTLPKSAEKLLKELIKASFFPKGKANKILQNLMRLDYKTRKNETND